MTDGYVVYSVLAVLRGEANEDPQIFIDPELIIAQDKQSALDKFILSYPEIHDDQLPVDVIITTFANTSTNKYQIVFDDDYVMLGSKVSRWDN